MAERVMKEDNNIAQNKLQTKEAVTLTTQQIESINSFGPYNHSVWSVENYDISNEERLSGRGEFLVERIKDCILRHFTLDEIKTFSILDVGCYDGWILHQLSDIPFKRMVGIEPRERNIEKGRKVREILGIHSRVEFKVGDIENIGDEVFDIVICTGVLHHVESIPHAIRSLRRACKRFLFIETLSLPSRYITDSLKKDVELKDIVYKYKNFDCGLIAQKYETSYYDGSAKDFCIVSLPTIESIMMYMDMEGFKDIQVVSDANNAKLLERSGRPINLVCLYGWIDLEKPANELNQERMILHYETGLTNTSLDISYIYPLYEIFVSKKHRAIMPLKSVLILTYLRSSGIIADISRRLIKSGTNNEFEFEIITNLKFNPVDKLRYEYAKILVNSGEYEKAIGELNAITQKINADWRSCYRSFCLLSQIYTVLGNASLSKKYKDLCQICNPDFPKILLEA